MTRHPSGIRAAGSSTAVIPACALYGAAGGRPLLYGRGSVLARREYTYDTTSSSTPRMANAAIR
jgi:hypothetical protein